MNRGGRDEAKGMGGGEAESGVVGEAEEVAVATQLVSMSA